MKSIAIIDTTNNILITDTAYVFNKYGYRTYIITKHISECDDTGIIWLNIDEFDSICDIMKFDYIIMSDVFNIELISKIEKNNVTQNVYIWSHNIHIYNNVNNIYNYSDPDNFVDNHIEMQSKIIKKYICLSDIHKHYLNMFNHVNENDCEVIPYYINPTYFTDIDFERKPDHRILWSSNINEGLILLTDYILPIVKNEINDFGIDIYNYENYGGINEYYDNNDSINIISNHLSKSELYNEMSKHACWVYPATYIKPFNITCIENILCGNNIILPVNDWASDIMKPYSKFLLQNKFNIYDFIVFPLDLNNKQYQEILLTDENNIQLINEIANQIIFSIKNYNNPYMVMHRESMKEYMLNIYSEENFINKWEKLFNE